MRSLSGVWRLLRRWHIGFKRGRRHVTSPDPEYRSKMQALEQGLGAARAEPDKVSLLYCDETTCYRHPVVAQAWHEQGSGGKCQKKATCSHKANNVRRIVGSLDALTGRVLYKANSRIGVSQLCAFLRQVRRAYGADRRLLLVWDNWPVHRLDHVLQEACDQRIELLWLPTYAPWTNPIEKLWKKLKEEVLMMHCLSGCWDELKEQVHCFLQSYDREAPELLHYVGITHPAKELLH